MLAPAALCLAGVSANAATITWSGATNGNWNNTPSNWIGGTPATGNTLQWDSSSTANFSGTNNYAGLIIYGINILNPGSAVSIAGNTFSIGAGGIDMSNATQDLSITPSVTFNASSNINVASGRTLTLVGAANVISSGTTNLNLSGAYAQSGQITIANSTGQNAGIIINNGGTITSGASIYIGYSAGSTGYAKLESGVINKSGGAGNQRLVVANSGTGTFIQTSGSVNHTLAIATGAGGVGYAEINDGVDTIALDMATGASSNATLAIKGGNVTVTTIGANSLAYGTSAQAHIILAGGTTSMPALPTNRGVGATADIKFDGGTLMPIAASTTYMSGFTNAWLTNKGAIIDTITFNITIAQVLSDYTGANGILTKKGSATLTFSGANTYSGATTISTGTLALAAAGSINNSATITVGDAGSSGAVLDLTAKSIFNILSGQTLKGIGAINIGSGKTLTVDSGAHWAPGNSIGTNSVTGNLTLAGVSDFELGAAGLSHAAPGSSDRTDVTGNLTLGGTLHLVNSSAGAGSYKIFTYTGTKSGSFGSTTDITGYHAAVKDGGAGTGSGQGIFLDNYQFASTAFNTTSIDLGKIHAGGSFGTQSLSIGNTLGSGTYNETLGVQLANTSGVSTSGTSTTVAAGAAADTSLTLGLTASTAAAGHKSGTVDVQFTSNEVNSSGLGTTALTSLNKTVTVNGDVYSGAGVWNTTGGGSYGTLANMANWTTNGGAPGLDSGFTQSDSATFSSALSSGSANVTLDGAAPSLTALTFDNANGSYALNTGTGSGHVIFNNGASAATLAASNGRHTINATVTLKSNLNASVANSGNILLISGNISGDSGKGLTKSGLGTLTLSGSSSYSGATTVQSGKLVVDGSIASAVTVDSGATLAGHGSTGALTLENGGTIAPGNSPGTLTVDSATFKNGSIFSLDLTTNGTGTAGVDWDQLNVTGSLDLTGVIAGGIHLSLVNYNGFTWDGTTNHIWGSVITYGSVSGYNTNLFAIDSSSFSGSGIWSVIQNTNTLDLQYQVVPEPSTWAMLVGGLGMLAFGQRVRRRSNYIK